MATRFYFPSTGTAPVSPAVHANWTVTAAAFARHPLVSTTPSSTAMTTVTGTADAATENYQVVKQYTIAGLAAQTISGTIKGQMRVAANGGGTPGRLAIAVFATDSGGAGRVDLLAPSASTDIAVPPAVNLATFENRRFEEGSNDFALDLTPQAVSAGWVLGVEIGFYDQTPNTGRTIDLSVGDDGGSDLPEDETTTAANNPWVEFSATIAFGGGGPTYPPFRPSYSVVRF